MATDRNGSEYVLDAEPLIAFFYAEDGHEVVAERLGSVASGDVDASLAAVNAAELMYEIARIEGGGTATEESLGTADRDVRALTRRGVELRRADWQLLGEVKAAGSISLADACAVALAHERDATLLAGADDDFDALPIDVEVERFREHPV